MFSSCLIGLYSTFFSVLWLCWEPFMSLYSFSMVFYYYCLQLLLVVFCVQIVLGFLPFIITYGVSIVYVILVSFMIWFFTIVWGFSSLLVYCSTSLFSLVLLLVDYFVMVLRPLTLSLRIIINISLGHVCVVILVNAYGSVVVGLFMFELFVYIIQTYVFIVLIKSYVA